MKSHKLFHASLLVAVFAAFTVLTFMFSGCSDGPKIPPGIPDPAPIVQSQEQKEATVIQKLVVIETQNNSIAASATTPAEKSAVQQTTQAISDIRAQITAHPVAQIVDLVNTLLTALNARDAAVTAAHKTIDSQNQTITSMKKHSTVITWLWIAGIALSFAAVACGFFASYVTAIPVVGPVIGKVIGPVFSGALGLGSVTCFAWIYAINWADAHPKTFAVSFGVLFVAAGVAIANYYWPTEVAAVEAKLKAYIAELEAKVGITKSAAPGSAVAPTPVVATVVPTTPSTAA